MTQPIGGDSVTDPLVGDQGESDEVGQAGNTDPAASAQSGAVETVSKAEYDAMVARMKAADQNRSRAETELSQLRNKDLPAAEKLSKERDEAVQLAQAMQQKLSEQLIANAFLTHSDVEWHNSKRALALLDMTGVHVDLDNAEVTGLKNAIEALTKSDPYLVKPKTEGTPATPPGTLPANNGGSGSGKPDSKKLVTRFPALRNRI